MDIMGGERKVTVGELGLKCNIGTIDKAKKNSIYFDIGLWIQPIEVDLITLSKTIKYRIKKKLNQLAKENLGDFKLILFNIESSDSPQSIPAGVWSYIRLETTIIFSDGDTFDHMDLRFIDMAEEIVCYISGMAEFNKLKFRPTRKIKAA